MRETGAIIQIACQRHDVILAQISKAISTARQPKQAVVQL
jgi:hypothetical protein